MPRDFDRHWAASMLTLLRGNRPTWAHVILGLIVVFGLIRIGILLARAV